MDHLGKMLKFLKEYSEEQEIKRSMKTKSLFAGQPNLIHCEDKDMYLTLLSLYMNSSEQPLPDASEVLFCSENTTSNAVGEFLLRAMLHTNSNGNYHFYINKYYSTIIGNHAFSMSSVPVVFVGFLYLLG